MNEQEFFNKLVAPILQDSTVIANAALTLAVERCTDLDMNPIVCLVMLKMIADKNAVEIIKELPPHIHAIASQNGFSTDDLQKTLESGLVAILQTAEARL